jgi:hypothetical protein
VLLSALGEDLLDGLRELMDIEGLQQKGINAQGQGPRPIDEGAIARA